MIQNGQTEPELDSGKPEDVYSLTVVIRISLKSCNFGLFLLVVFVRQQSLPACSVQKYPQNFILFRSKPDLDSYYQAKYVERRSLFVA